MSYVYLMHSGDRYKIGKADDVQERLETFRTADPEIQLIATIHTSDAYKLEAALHRRYQRQRIWADHEWFYLSPRDVRAITQLGQRHFGGLHVRFTGSGLVSAFSSLGWVGVFVGILFVWSRPGLIVLPPLTLRGQVAFSIAAWLVLIVCIVGVLRYKAR